MHSYSKIVSHIINGTCEVFVLNAISVINLYEEDLNTLTKLELILPHQHGITMLQLHTSNSSFRLETTITSNANLALITEAPFFIISNKTKLEAEQLLITNYLVDEEQLHKSNSLTLMPSSGDRYIINYGNILARNDQKSGISSDKFVNRGTMSDNVDYKTYVGLKRGQLVSADLYAFQNPDGEMSIMGKLFKFIFGDYYD